MLEGYPTLIAVTDLLDNYLKSKHELFFGEKPEHPFLPLKPYKDIHDPVWGTNGFSWRELALIDTPILQRLRHIHQTGFAFHVYPSARHSRFEHSLGVLVVATKVFDAVARRHAGKLRQIVTITTGESENFQEILFRWRQELRLASLLHDAGHSILSHTSERVYGRVPILQTAASELSELAAAEKKAGEVISFCLSRTNAVNSFLKRAKSALIKECEVPDEFEGEPDMDSVSLLIIGRSRHPLLQFLGDIVSSGFDADKLDYLLRDAAAAGLPLRYDLERYLATVHLPETKLNDGKGKLEKLYKRVCTVKLAREPKGEGRFPYYRSHRLKLPKRSMNTIEQVTICKLMLYSYIYHHPKVRASEGLFERLLSRIVQNWRLAGKSDEEIVLNFMDFDDTALQGPNFLTSTDEETAKTSYRLLNRLMPRVVYEIVSSPAGAEGKLLSDFFSKLGDPGTKSETLQKVEAAMGRELCKRRQELGTEPTLACVRAGAWFDVPSLPTFEGMDELVGEADGKNAVRIGDMFPINKWTEAYHAHRYAIRIYSFSEYCSDVAVAARKGLEEVTRISDPDFYQRCRRVRS